MMAVPAALLGIIWTLALTGTTINVMSLMGAIMAVGISVSNSILVVTFANDLRSRNESLIAVRGGDRVRQDPVAAGADDRAGDDHGHGADGARAGRRRRAERAARPRRDRRAVFATFATLLLVPIFYTLLRKNAAGAAHARSTFCRRSRRRIEGGLGPWLVRKKAARRSSMCSASVRCVIAVGAVVYFHVTRNQNVASAREARAVVADRGPRVEFVTATAGPTERTIKLLGDVRSGATAVLYAKVAGYIKEVHGRQGRQGRGRPDPRGDRVAGSWSSNLRRRRPTSCTSGAIWRASRSCIRRATPPRWRCIRRRPTPRSRRTTSACSRPRCPTRPCARRSRAG